MPLAEPVAAVAVERSWGALGRAAVAQMQGRSPSYEDAHLVSQELGACGVYGGHRGGEAAAFAAARLHRHAVAAGAPTAEALRAAFVACDEEMRRALPRAAAAQGSSAALALARELQGGPGGGLSVVVANCGDARAVLWRRGPDEIEETRDHRPSDPQERSRIESAGGRVVGEAAGARVDGELACSRALGGFRFKSHPSLPPGNQKISAVPDVYEWRAMPGDWLLVASGGVWDAFSSVEVVRRLCKSQAQDELGSRLATFLTQCVAQPSAIGNLTIAAVELGAAPHRLAPVLSVMPFGYAGAADRETLAQYGAFCRRFGRLLEKQSRAGRSVVSMSAVALPEGPAAFALRLAPPPPPQGAVRLPLQLPLEEALVVRSVTDDGGERAPLLGCGAAAGLLLCCGGRPTAPAVRGDTGRAEAPVAAGVHHGAALPQEYARQIPAEDRQVLDFLLALLRSEGLGSVKVFINGGYVRDLLLGKSPDDLDLSFCLRDCRKGVKVTSMLDNAPRFAARHPEFGITDVDIVTCLSDGNSLDTTTAHFTVASGRRIEVDALPTIGEEVYDERSRVPVRDERGTPEQDSLRRDLTIGALLLQVLRDGSGDLRYELLDHYDGLGDLRRGVLRTPCPHGIGLREVEARVLRSDADKALARSVGIDALPDAEAIHALWWAKVLMDDPLRVPRALRFAAKLGFELHDSFWLALPFATQALRGRVAGERKFTEYTKVGAYGAERCAAFFGLAFGRPFGPPGEPQRAAPALFAGLDDKRQLRGLSPVETFDEDLYASMASSMRAVGEPPELLGGLLACACFAAFGGGRAGSQRAAEEFASACAGMAVNRPTREAGASVLDSLQALEAAPAAPDRLDLGFAKAAGVSPESLCMHLHVWRALQMPRYKGSQDGVSAARRSVVLQMLRRAAPGRHAEAEACARALELRRPAVKGSILDAKGVLHVPGPLRTRVMVLLEVCLRLLHFPGPLETAEHLQAIFASNPAIREALDSSVWCEADGKTLRQEFSPKKDKGSKK